VNQRWSVVSDNEFQTVGAEQRKARLSLKGTNKNELLKQLRAIRRIEVLVLLTSLQNIVILSIIVTVCVTVKSTNVVCPHNGTYDLCIFAIFPKTGFVDIAPLCCKPSI